MTQGLAAAFPPETTQVSAALSYPGTIKAFHFHQHQTDLWVPMQGMFQVALVDLRPESPTFGVKNTLYAGALPQEPPRLNAVHRPHGGRPLAPVGVLELVQAAVNDLERLVQQDHGSTFRCSARLLLQR